MPGTLLDPGFDDTIFPPPVAALIGVQLRSEEKHAVRWRGQRYALAFGDIRLELNDAEKWRWRAVRGFSDAAILSRTNHKTSPEILFGIERQLDHPFQQRLRAVARKIVQYQFLGEQPANIAEFE